MARLHRFAPRIAAVALALRVAGGATSAPLTTASAANDSWRYHDRDWHGDWNHHNWNNYRSGGSVYFSSPGYYYAPPPTYYYAPPPAYYYPPAPAPYYGPSFGFSVRVR